MEPVHLIYTGYLLEPSAEAMGARRVFRSSINLFILIFFLK
jgi:hypothetical protein